jgi:hypothetical protein
MRRTFEISATIIIAILAAMAFHAWLTSHDEQLRMQAVIATQKQLLDAADAREHNRTTVLDQTLAEIEKLKRETQTPEQILNELPKYLALPQPITLTPSPVAGKVSALATPDQGNNRKGTGPRSNGARADSPAPAEGPASSQQSPPRLKTPRPQIFPMPQIKAAPLRPLPRFLPLI